jgi:hypothetical protein
MQVNNTINIVIVILHLYPVLDGSKIVADMDIARCWMPEKRVSSSNNFSSLEKCNIKGKRRTRIQFWVSPELSCQRQRDLFPDEKHNTQHRQKRKLKSYI